MAITRVTAGSQASIDDLNQLIELLEGTSGYELAFLLRCLAGSDFKIRLSDASGTREFIIQDSAGVSVATIDSDGNMMINGSFAPGTIVLPTATGPSQTTEGAAVWDSDDDRLTVGTGSATKVIGLSRGAGLAASATQELAYDTTAAALKAWDGSASVAVGRAPVARYKTATQTLTATTTYADVTATSGNFAFDITANSVWRARFVLPFGVSGNGGLKVQLTGPSAPTLVAAKGPGYPAYDFAATAATTVFPSATAFSADIFAYNASGAGVGTTIGSGTLILDVIIVNGANAGTVTLQAAQNTAAGSATLSAGCFMEAVRLD